MDNGLFLKKLNLCDFWSVMLACVVCHQMSCMRGSLFTTKGHAKTMTFGPYEVASYRFELHTPSLGVLVFLRLLGVRRKCRGGAYMVPTQCRYNTRNTAPPLFLVANVTSLNTIFSLPFFL